VHFVTSECIAEFQKQGEKNGLYKLSSSPVIWIKVWLLPSLQAPKWIFILIEGCRGLKVYF